MSFKGARRVSLLTLEGRIIVPLIMGKHQSERFNGKHGQCDLVRRKDGKWFLLVTADLPDGTPQPATDFIGVDLGVENIATDSDGGRASGAQLERVRQKNHKQRQALPPAAAKSKAKGQRPKSIRRKLKNLSGREARFRRDTNHVISERLVEKATDTHRGIALEELKGIRERTRFRKKQRAKRSGWRFSQLRGFLEDQVAMAGVPVGAGDPQDPSQMRAQGGHLEKANRQSRSEFLGRSGGVEAQADQHGALNVRARALPQRADGLGKAAGKSREVQGQAPPRAR